MDLNNEQLLAEIQTDLTLIKIAIENHIKKSQNTLNDLEELLSKVRER